MNWNTSAKKRSSKAKRKHDELRNSYRPDQSESRVRSKPIETVADVNVPTKRKSDVSFPQRSDHRAVIRTATIYTKPLRNEFVPPNVSADVFYLANTKPNRTEQSSSVKCSNQDLSTLLELTPTDDQVQTSVEEQVVLFINEGKIVNYEPTGDIVLQNAAPVRQDDVLVQSSSEVDPAPATISADNWLPRYYKLESMLPPAVKDLIITKENELKSSMKTDYLCSSTRLKLLYALYEHSMPQNDSTQLQLLEIIRFLEQVDKTLSAQEMSRDTRAASPPVETQVREQEWVLFESSIPSAQLSAPAPALQSSAGTHTKRPQEKEKRVCEDELDVRFFL